MCTYLRILLCHDARHVEDVGRLDDPLGVADHGLKMLNRWSKAFLKLIGNGGQRGTYVHVY